jgi:2-polyprenyl-3-methyl-5-hydroxy-6-metoxy-1,4-benzoquinol methylase
MELENHTINQKYSDYIQPLNQDLYRLIDSRLITFDKEWSKKTILDYGCNIGNLLTTSQGIIKEDCYTGIDVQEKALTIAQRNFPNATFIKSNYHHPAFNSTGSFDFPLVDKKFDIIFCIGVFTHCDMNYIKKHIEFFKSLLNKDGYIVFSIWEDYHFGRYLELFLRFVLKIEFPKSVYKPFTKSIYLVNRKESVADVDSLELKEVDWLETFFHKEYLHQSISNLKLLDGPRAKHSFYLVS